MRPRAFTQPFISLCSGLDVNPVSFSLFVLFLPVCHRWKRSFKDLVSPDQSGTCLSTFALSLVLMLFVELNGDPGNKVLKVLQEDVQTVQIRLFFKDLMFWVKKKRFLHVVS